MNDKINGLNDVIMLTSKFGPMTQSQVDAFCDAIVKHWKPNASGNNDDTSFDLIKLLLPGLRILKRQKFDYGLELNLSIRKLLDYADILGFNTNVHQMVHRRTLDKNLDVLTKWFKCKLIFVVRCENCGININVKLDKYFVSFPVDGEKPKLLCDRCIDLTPHDDPTKRISSILDDIVESLR